MESPFERRALVGFISRVSLCSMLEQKLDGVGVSPVRGPMESCIPMMSQTRIDVDAMAQQEIDHARAAKLTCPRETILELLLFRRGL